jgi:hypothetical protein
VNTGGWGLRLKTEDMAKVGQLYLQKGNWYGNQILTSAWIEEASAEKIFRHPELPKSARDTSDWEQGYGYQIWRCRYQAYRADGAYGQYIIVLPDLDAVIVIQSESPDMQDELNMVWEYLLPAFKKGKIPADQKSLLSLKDKLTSLSILPKSGSASALTANYNFNRNYILEPNESHLESLVIQIKDSICHFIMNTGSDTYNLLYGSGKWKTGQTNKAGPSMFSYAKENYALLLPYKIAGSYYWKDAQTLVMEMRYLESPHMETTVCHFEGKKISVDVEYSLDFGKKKTVYSGTWK